MSERNPFTLDVKSDGDVVIMTFTGKILIGEGDIAIYKAVHAVIASNKSHQHDDEEDKVYNQKIIGIAFVLSHCSYMDSGGLGELVRSHTSLTREGIKFALVGLSAKHKDLMATTKLHTIFDIYDDLETAKTEINKSNTGGKQRGFSTRRKI